MFFASRQNCRFTTECFNQKWMQRILFWNNIVMNWHSWTIKSKIIKAQHIGDKVKKTWVCVNSKNIKYLHFSMTNFCGYLHRFFSYKKIIRINWIKPVFNNICIFIKTENNITRRFFKNIFINKIWFIYKTYFLTFEFKVCSRNLQCMQALSLSVFTHEQM